MNAGEHIAVLSENIRTLDDRAAELISVADIEGVLSANSEALSKVRAQKANREQGVLAHDDAARYYASRTALYLNTHETAKIDESFLCELYGRLQNRAVPRELMYRRDDMFVWQNNAAGESIAFVAVPGEDVEAEMEKLFREYSGEMTLYDACRLPMDFMNIHPHPDMNGRVSRVLFETALHKLGFRAAYLLPLEESICYNTKLYLQVLAAANGRCYDAPKNYDIWVRYLLDRVALAYALLIHRLKMSAK